MTRGRILVIDDEPLNRDVLRRVLKDDFRVETVNDAETGWLRLQRGPEIEVLLLDLVLPGMGGLQLLDRIRADTELKDLPVLIISGLNSAEDEERGFLRGASDYISKPFRHAVVTHRVRNHLEFARQRKQLKALATTDPLTQLYNRRGLQDMLKREFSRARRNGNPLSLALVDIDYFKQYNDHYGHQQGDLALQRVAQVLKNITRRPGDLVARYGGEEFILVWPETAQEGARQAANELLKAVAAEQMEHEFSEVADFLTISLGGATFAGDELTESELIERADRALYRAKAGGRNCARWSE